jgi:hypothetical protein
MSDFTPKHRYGAAFSTKSYHNWQTRTFTHSECKIHMNAEQSANLRECRTHKNIPITETMFKNNNTAGQLPLLRYTADVAERAFVLETVISEPHFKDSNKPSF